MNTKIRYDLDSLELANGDFGYPITEKEVRKVNRMPVQDCPKQADVPDRRRLRGICLTFW